MAILIVEHRGKMRGTALPPRVLIGRRSMNHLVIDDPAVSRMHAWIDQLGAGYYLTDMHSRTGTRVNGQPAYQQQQLSDGDVIEIGPARLTFRDVDQIPPGIERFELPQQPVLSSRDVGIQFDCPQCTAPLWAAPQFAGHTGECSYCHEAFTVPAPVAADAFKGALFVATPVAVRPGPEMSSSRTRVHNDRHVPAVAETTKPAPTVRCGVCQSPILPLEARTTCPACGLLFHEECWQENYGCSAYGCSQVDVLKPPEPKPAAGAATGQEAVAADADVMPPARTPWEFVVLGASALAVLVSAVSFGGASALALFAAIAYWVKGKREPEQKRGAIIGAMALSVVGIAAGIALSYYFFIYSGGGRRR
jgi:hypothetical protein